MYTFNFLTCVNVGPTHLIKIQRIHLIGERMRFLLVTPNDEHVILPNARRVSVPRQRYVPGDFGCRPAVPQGVETEQHRARGMIVPSAPDVYLVLVDDRSVPVALVGKDVVVFEVR